MAEPRNRADDRPRIYLKHIRGDRMAWRDGWHGRDRHENGLEATLSAILKHVGYEPAVIFYEGGQDHD